ncbi:fumarylacetoacetate hydrolase family protein [Halobacillus litoralis]|uniref:fumarylacetoacetate hydrolase family protein n=1 Tax=Halobacillus litoralis TaxID=45668 RepID=UPI001CFDEEBE|nr:fumarylacetoacetate hydrolase family protein [Halobacillus litoralis]
MRLATIEYGGVEKAVVVEEDIVYPLNAINDTTGQQWPEDLYELIQPPTFSSFRKWWQEQTIELKSKMNVVETPSYRPLYRHPRKIWGIGLNYTDHASDLDEKAPGTEPASFMKPDTTIIGAGDSILLPLLSDRTTGEAELGVIIGETCKDVTREDAAKVIAGYTTIIDMTAEDILKRNPRFLTRSKSFDTFFSFGPQLFTPDEIDHVLNLNVTTKINGRVHRSNKVDNMTFDPYELVAFHSQVMTLLPGDIISTGTPGAVVLRDGDVVECEIDGFPNLINPVEDLKADREDEVE